MWKLSQIGHFAKLRQNVKYDCEWGVGWYMYYYYKTFIKYDWYLKSRIIFYVFLCVAPAVWTAGATTIGVQKWPQGHGHFCTPNYMSSRFVTDCVCENLIWPVYIQPQVAIQPILLIIK